MPRISVIPPCSSTSKFSHVEEKNGTAEITFITVITEEGRRGAGEEGGGVVL